MIKMLVDATEEKNYSAQELQVNSLYKIDAAGSGRDKSVVVRIQDKIYEITDFSDYWTVKDCSFKFRKLNPGEKVILENV